MEDEFEKSSIENLKRTLYSRNEKLVPKEKRSQISQTNSDAPKDWGENSSFNSIINNESMSKRNNSFFNKFFLGSLIFFLLALGAATYIFFGGINMISSDNLDIKVTAPSQVASGESVPISIDIVNGNRTELQNVKFFIDYPTGALSVTDGKPLTRDQVSLDNIPSGGSKNYSVQAVVVGEKDTVQSFVFRIEYTVAGSNATFSKEKTYDVLINSSPVILQVSYPKEINSGQQITLSIDIISNSNVVMKNAIVKVDYPFDFEYINSNMKPVRDNSVWNIGDLKNGDKKTLSITGKLSGQNMEDRSFNISIGTQASGSVSDYDAPLATSIATIGIRKSLFDLSINATPVVTATNDIPVTINWGNILPDKILNAVITANLSGNIFDRSSVSVTDGGYYKSINNSIIWDKTAVSSFASISPGNTGKVSFTVAPIKDSLQTKTIKNPHIDIQVDASGNRSGTETGVVSSDQSFTIKFASNLILTAKSLRATGPLSNSGPIPPRADTETTYTVTLTLTNTHNDLSNSVVTGILPQGVEWKNEISPTSERISYNPETRMVYWNVGTLSYGTGYIYSPKEVSFKVGLTPSLSDVGSTPVLVNSLRATGLDTYTNTQLTSNASNVTTQYSDPGYTQSSGMVVR